MSQSLESMIRQRVGLLPLCGHYSELLGVAVRKLAITENEARKRYGRFTYAEWAGVLNL